MHFNGSMGQVSVSSFDTMSKIGIWKRFLRSSSWVAWFSNLALEKKVVFWFCWVAERYCLQLTERTSENINHGWIINLFARLLFKDRRDKILTIRLWFCFQVLKCINKRVKLLLSMVWLKFNPEPILTVRSWNLFSSTELIHIAQ